MTRLVTLLVALLSTALPSVERTRGEDRPQWGGLRRDFTTTSALPAAWPEGGPKLTWERPLGEGFSGVAVADGALYTMVRRDSREVVVSLDAATGVPRWSYSYDAPFSSAYSMENGEGPHATPLIVGGRVFTVGATGRLHALDARTGAVVWTHDLVGELGGFIRVNGYACSPLAVDRLVIVTVGGKSGAVVAFDQATGRSVWQSEPDRISPSSPVIIERDGARELVAFLYDRVVGLDPRTGATRWSHPHVTDFGLNVATPIWTDGQVLVVSSAYNGGTRALRIDTTAAGAAPRELWFSNRLRLHFATAILVDGLLCGSSGDLGPAPFTAVDVATGALVWRNRALGRATGLRAPNGLLLLDEDGQLSIADATREGLTIRSKAPVVDGVAWTTPTIANGRIYIRNRRVIKAFDLE
jgi:outer membrane protein assembly factor BamB